MPLPLKLLPLISLGMGAAQTGIGLSQAARNRRPTDRLLRENLRRQEGIAEQAAMAARFGLSPEDLAQRRSQARAFTALAAANARNLGAAPMQMQAMGTQARAMGERAELEALVMDQQVRDARRQYADQQAAAAAAHRAQILDFNMSNFRERAAASNALIGAGLQNLMKSGQNLQSISANRDFLGQASGVMGQMNAPANQYTAAEMQALKELGPSAAPAPMPRMKAFPPLAPTPYDGPLPPLAPTAPAPMPRMEAFPPLAPTPYDGPLPPLAPTAPRLHAPGPRVGGQRGPLRLDMRLQRGGGLPPWYAYLGY